MLDFTLLLILFAVAFSIYTAVFAKRYQINNISHPISVGVYFLLWIGLVVMLFPDPSLTFFTLLIQPASLLSLCLGYVTFVVLYMRTKEEFVQPTQLIEGNNSQNFLQLKYAFLYGKSFDILFQQLVFFIVFGIAINHFGYSVDLFMAFAAFIALLHIPLIFVQGFFWALYYTIFSFVGASLFAFLILSFDIGVALSFLVHLGFYVCAGVIAWIRFN